MTIISLEQFKTAIQHVGHTDIVALDCETSGLDPLSPDAVLLGVSVSSLHLTGCDSFYIPLFNYDLSSKQFKPAINSDLRTALQIFLSEQTSFIGQNFTFDEAWIEVHLGVRPSFKHDTQILWHLSSAPAKKQSYSLKAAMTQVLGWESANDKELKDSITARNEGRYEPKFYLAEPSILAKYAALDAKATFQLFNALKPFFDRHDYWNFEQKIISYKRLLLENNRNGIPVEVDTLKTYKETLIQQRSLLEHRLRSEVCAKEIEELEFEWRKKWIEVPKTENGRIRRALQAPKEEKLRFNMASGKHLEELFYDKLKFQPFEYTKTGKGKTDKSNLRIIAHPAAELLLKYSKLAKLESFCESYLEKAVNGILRPSFNVTGTVSGRLTSYSPNMQQAPFGESDLMCSLRVPEGRVGVQADLVSIEPYFTAYFSEDPTLLKVYREGKGDIYLDLALTLFPSNFLLGNLYDPYGDTSAAIKAQFKQERGIAKTVHLACAYGAGPRKIAETLTKNGFPTKFEEGKRLHTLYWKKFNKVKEFEAKLYEIYRDEGFLTNPFGRIVRIPDFWCKDLMNRFIQSTAHDALMHWVMEIDALRKEQNFDMIPILADVHDATAWHVKEGHYEEGKKLFEDALRNVNQRLDLEFPIRAEVHSFYTFADFK